MFMEFYSSKVNQQLDVILKFIITCIIHFIYYKFLLFPSKSSFTVLTFSHNGKSWSYDESDSSPDKLYISVSPNTSHMT